MTMKTQSLIVLCSKLYWNRSVRNLSLSTALTAQGCILDCDMRGSDYIYSTKNRKRIVMKVGHDSQWCLILGINFIVRI